MNKINDIIQWLGTFFVITGHLLISIGNMDPFNIISFMIGILLFLTWAVRVKNTPQTVANIFCIIICIFGLYRAYSY
jgi:hypothetical protein